ncbi:MAG: prepilin-type N-terminal cleavage/methylation domain-containing protein [Desulfobacterales bacterium]
MMYTKRYKGLPSLRVSKSGFTLLEIMVAISIMAIVLVGIYRLHAQTIAMNMDAKFYTTAPLLAQKKIAETEMTQIDNFTSDSGEFDDGFSGYSWRINVEDYTPELLGSAAEDMKRIHITVQYRDELTYHLTTYRFIRG